MQLTVLKAKLHRATITQADLEYEGSISIDRHLLDVSGILPFEQVDVYNITNGARFTTYAIEAPAHSGRICVNGAAARLVGVGDLIIICAYGICEEAEAKQHQPRVILVDANNAPRKV